MKNTICKQNVRKTIPQSVGAKNDNRRTARPPDNDMSLMSFVL